MTPPVNLQQMPDTRRRLLDAAIHLIMRQGFAATTVDEICLESDLTKGSFFHYFKSKDEIGEKALEHYCAKMGSRFADAPFQSIQDPLEKVHAFLDHFANLAGRPEIVNGCLIGDLTQEVAGSHPKIRRQCDAAFGKMIGLFSSLLDDAKTAHPPKINFDSTGIATLFASVMQGSMLLVKARRDSQLILNNLKYFNSYIDTLFGKTRAPRRKPTS